MGKVAELAGTWRGHAEMLRRYGDDRGATVLEALAGQLEEAIRDQEQEVLTLSQAAAESGYSKRRLRELMADGKLNNQGERGRPRILRGDLPVKPVKQRPAASPGSRDTRYDPLQDARRLVGQIGVR